DGRRSTGDDVVSVLRGNTGLVWVRPGPEGQTGWRSTRTTVSLYPRASFV
ncbi:hypothetical protein SERLA73DRAFT_175145, partial [Serpula lacrymans var. lacrymans S7.3]